MTKFQPPSALHPLLATLEVMARDAGVAAYVVGGTVRDVLLAREVRDLDIAVDRDALPFARCVADALGGHFVELDDEHVVARVVLRSDAVAGSGVEHVDVARLQGTLEQDLRRRDFTIDAMAVAIGDTQPIDPRGGLADLTAKTVRMNGPDVFAADPLRLLRGARIAAELVFTVEPATAAEIRARARNVVRAAPERRRDELARIFALDASYPALRQLDGLCLLDALLPELAAGRGVPQPKEHAYDVFEHNLRTVEALDLMLSRRRRQGVGGWVWDELWSAFGWCEDGLRGYFGERVGGWSRASLLKLASLLHDVAKPQTREMQAGGRMRFFGHADVGAETVRRIMRRYRFSTKETRFAALLVEEHLRPVQLAQAGEVPTRRALYRFYQALGDAVPAVLFLSLADSAAARGPRLTPAGWARHVRYMNSIVVRSQEEEGIVHPPRLLNGHDIMSALGIAEGPLVGRLLRELQEAEAAGEVGDVKAALSFVRRRARGESETAGTST